MAIVYLTTNLINGKKYIGSTARTDKDVKYYLGSGVNISQAIKKYGKENFTRETLWEGPKEVVREIETFYCTLNNVASDPQYYNCTNQGTGTNIGIKWTEEQREKYIKSKTGVIQTPEWKDKKNKSHKETIQNNGFWSEKFKKPIKIVSPEGKEYIFSSHKEAKEVLKIQPNKLIQLKNNKIKWGKWLGWQYLPYS